MNSIIEKLSDFYLKLDLKSVQNLDAIYGENIVFTDPAHQLDGLPALRAYFVHLIENLEYCSIEVQEVLEQETSDKESQAFIIWIMTFKHPRLKKGKPIVLAGVSHIKFQEKIHYHRDYFDLGAMLYEHLPLIGRIILNIKRRLAQ